ncbi:MAG: TRAP transporter large permease [Synergistales bacterium]|jgi:C4-dicarboxylate transporter DctM subunit|nr:TRAP transporter large permease [Synergistales bacterium]MDD3830744.1 TRAP transporter large permease [Synergistales bacterium]MDD4023964.1 TRAP transporter large permease [Synergistales bacterium]MDD5515412.1 TRAP transporter large permease [Synergistales bacterium]
MLMALASTLIVCFLLNVPIGFALGMAALASLIASGSMPIAMIPQRMVAGANSFPLLAIPFFMLAGAIMERGGVSRRIVNLASALVGHITGGLAAVSIVACTFFAAISGSTPATAAAVGGLTIPEMEKRGYARSYASAVVASASCLGVIIPPSITMVIFGIVANVSVGQLLIGGILPGLFLSFILLCVNYVRSRQLGYPTEDRRTWRERWKTFSDAVWGLMMPVIILGGIMTGVFTPTESAAIAVVYGLFVSFFIYRELGLRDLVPIFYKASLNSAMIMLLIAAASPFGWIMTIEQVPQIASTAILGLSSNMYVIYILMLVIYLILGTFMETGAIILLVVPIFAPIAEHLGIDMIQFGVVTVIALAIGMATPPVGIALFATCGIADITIGQLTRKIIPFLIALIIGLFILAFVPVISTFLPELLF